MENLTHKTVDSMKSQIKIILGHLFLKVNLGRRNEMLLLLLVLI